MITIDGSQGEGGGQILRSSLTLAVVTGQAVTVRKIRAGRKKPGLMRQHLTAAKAIAQIGSGTLDGARIGATELRFAPGTIRGGDYDFAIGTAGSTMLVLQTVLPALLCADAPSTLYLEGGTHNPMSPPFDFFERVYLPLLRKMGADVDVELERPGFYPAGGGAVRIQVRPTKRLQPLELLDRGERLQRRATARLAHLNRGIGERELAVVREQLGYSDSECEITTHPDSIGPGNLITVEEHFENISELCTGFGEIRKSAERVARSATDGMRAYLATNAPVGEHLADQLLLPLALAGGGTFRTSRPSQHTRTNMDVIEQFLPVTIELREERDGTHVLELRRGSD